MRSSHMSFHRSWMWLRAQTAHVADHLVRLSPRNAATFNIGSLLIAIIAMSLWQPNFRFERVQSPAAPLAPAPSASVKMIDAAPRGSECHEQTWPYIDRNCLNYGSAKTEAEAAPVAQLPVQPVVTPPEPAAQSSTERAALNDQSFAAVDAELTGETEEMVPAKTEEELRAEAKAEARQRRRERRHHGHFWIGPFRF